jgi:hypothetical protein
MNGSFTTHSAQIQARSESPTLGLEEEEDASAMLAALDITRPPPRPTRAAPPVPPMARLPLPTPPSSAHSSVPDLGHYRSTNTLSRRGSITSSEATSLATPCPSLSGSSNRESTLLPRGSYSTLDSRGSGSSQYGKGLETLSENGSGRGGFGLNKSNSMKKDYQLHHVDSTAPPPSAYSSHQAQIISALSTYQMEGRMPVSENQLRRQQSQVGPHTQTTSHLPYLANDKMRHLSMNTDSSSSSYSSNSHGHKSMGSIVTSDTASAITDYNVHLASSVNLSNLSRTETGGSGSTGTSSKKQLKEEKKA